MDNNFEKLYKLSTENKENINIIEGIASEYDTIDKTGEIIRSGAFDSSIGKVIPIWVMHQGINSTIGTATLEKSGKKLLIKGELFDNEMGKTIALAKSKGVQYNLSIGGTLYLNVTISPHFRHYTKKSPEYTSGQLW